MSFDLDVLHDAIEADIKAAFPAFQTVEFYAEYRKGMPLPAILLEITDWQKFDDPDPGTEQLAVTARFEARIIIDGIRTREAKRVVRKLMAALSLFLYQRRWTNPADSTKKLPTGPADFMAAYPDQFDPALDQFEVWRAEWEQVLRFGPNVWDQGTDFLPGRVFVGEAPNIGAGHEQDYIEVTLSPLDIMLLSDGDMVVA